MKGIDDKQAELIQALVTISADGLTMTGGVITFAKPFINIPCSCVVCVLGTVALGSQPSGVWVSTCTKTACTITVLSALPAAYRSNSFIVGVFVHEQL